jgi:hypothetical protein
MIRFCFILSLSFFFVTCHADELTENPQPIREEDKGIPARWADVSLQVIRQSIPGSPTYTSRSLGYLGLTMYECLVHGSDNKRSMVGQLNGLTALPAPEDAEYNWLLTLNAGQAELLRLLYPHCLTPEIITRLENTIFLELTTNQMVDVTNRSIAYGRALANAVFEWAKLDGGHEGYLRNFDPNYIFPKGESYWTPPVDGQIRSLFPLHPYWGNNRTFLSTNNSLPIPIKEPFSISTQSNYYRYFHEVYQKRLNLTNEEKRIAAWWADDPTQTPSPPAHSYNLATIIITSEKADDITAAEVYARVGMAVADAFIACWKCKYTYHSERPLGYIRSNIDANYTQFWPEPPFPAFTSGHATQSAAAAEVLIDVFGNEVKFVDTTHEGRVPDFEDITYVSRIFFSIRATAEECAYSRFLGGIHTQHDNLEGTNQGMKVGKNIKSLTWSK